MPTEMEHLRAQIEAERTAHAAEVARLRAALNLAPSGDDYRIMAISLSGSALSDDMQQHIERYDRFRNFALAAPPTAAIEAVEGMRKALEAQVCGLCCNRIGWTGDLTQALKFLGRGDWRTCVRCHDARAALAAYEEALRG